jgi:uncharacterized protein (DUF305 family)
MRAFNAKSILQLGTVVLVSATLSTPAYACDEHKKNAQPVVNHQSSNDAEHQMPIGENAYTAVMDKMHKSMMIEGTGDADADFMRGMIPHHQGAIDMAKIALEKGKDPVVSKLAQEIIKAQEKEISLMNNWLTTRIEP